MPFRAVTYNVLANAYIRPQWYGAVPPELLRPECRIPALVRHVEGLSADVLCLQEVEDETIAALKARLGDYEAHYEKKRGKPDGCATFFRRGVFSSRGVKRLEYRDAPQLALLLSLEHAGCLLGVANTHLRWDSPETPLVEQIGYRQALELLSQCEAYRPLQDAWLICGDFNRTPDSGVVSALLQRGYLHPHQPPVKSCVANGKAALIDYLLHTPGLRVRPLEVPRVGDESPLPSAEQPSDHLALAADFEWA